MVLFAIVTMVIVFPWFAIMIVVLAIVFGFVYSYFRSAVRELKRLDNITRLEILFGSFCRFFLFIFVKPKTHQLLTIAQT